MLQYKENAIMQQLAEANTASSEIERNMQQLTVSGSTEQIAISGQINEPEQSRQELLQELGRQKTMNAALKEVCEEAHSDMVYERTGQRIKGVSSTNNSTALAGFIGLSSGEGWSHLSQDISDIRADNNSIAMAGVMRDVDLSRHARPS